MILFFDTETTGKADFNKPSSHTCQPRLVQLAALLFDLSGSPIHSLSSIVKPNGFNIPPEASKVHGISTEKANAVGLPSGIVLEIFESFLSMATMVVGHNVDYDVIVLERERGRSIDQPTFCTMKSSTDICKIPGPYGFRWPKLSEVYKFAFNRELIGAHDALADIRATKEVYDWLMTKVAPPSRNISETPRVVRSEVTP